MHLIKIEQHFDSAHFLAGYSGKCSNIHGHRWRVQVEVQSEGLVKEGQLRGMVTDFSDLKRDVGEILAPFDHALIIEEGSMRRETLQCLMEDGFKIMCVKFRTTAENLAYYFYQRVQEKGYNVRRVTIYETPTNSASYEHLEGII